MILEKQPYGQPTRIPIDPVERFRIDTVRRMRLKMLQKRDALPVEPDAYPVGPLLNCTTVLWTEPSTRSPETFSSGCASTQMGCLAEAFKFLKGPAEMLQLYEQSYQRANSDLIL